MPSDPVFLTGGSGLIGSHVAERLRTQGAEVVALQRRGSDTRRLESIGCRVVVGDLTDSVESYTSQLAGCRSIVHAAARTEEPMRDSLGSLTAERWNARVL